MASASTPSQSHRSLLFFDSVQSMHCRVNLEYVRTFGRSDYRELSPFRHDRPGQDLIIGRRLLVGRLKIGSSIILPLSPPSFTWVLDIIAGMQSHSVGPGCWLQTAAAILKHSCHSKQAIHQNGSLWKGDWLVIGAALQFLTHHPNRCIMQS